LLGARKFSANGNIKLEEDPIIKEQIEVLYEILGDDIDDEIMQGFLIVCSRLVDNYGNHRTRELEKIFRTNTDDGKDCLKNSLKALSKSLGTYENYAFSYPVSIIPPNPIFPMLKMVGIENITKSVYRALDSKSKIRNSGELVEKYIMRTGKLPCAAPPKDPVLRSKPKFVHWCSYVKLPTPSDIQEGLQILPEWSDCKLRATIHSKNITDNTYMAYNGDRHDPNDKSLGFYGYFFELLTQDHPPLSGGEVQIKVFGEPMVAKLEKWCDKDNCWSMV